MRTNLEATQLQAETLDAEAQPSLIDQIAEAQAWPIETLGILAEIDNRPSTAVEYRVLCGICGRVDCPCGFSFTVVR